MKQNVINETAYKTIWCPCCRMEKRLGDDKFAYVVWISPEMVLVCQYLVCHECTSQVWKLSKAEHQKTSDRCEDALLGRYPQLKQKLPQDYTVGGSDIAR